MRIDYIVLVFFDALAAGTIPHDFVLILRCSVIVWNILKKEAICGSPAQAPSAGLTHTLAYSNTSDEVFITGGRSVCMEIAFKMTIAVWFYY